MKEINFRVKERMIAIGIMMMIQVSALMLLIYKIIGGIEFFIILAVALFSMLIYNNYCYHKVNDEIWKKP